MYTYCSAVHVDPSMRDEKNNLKTIDSVHSIFIISIYSEERSDSVYWNNKSWIHEIIHLTLYTYKCRISLWFVSVLPESSKTKTNELTLILYTDHMHMHMHIHMLINSRWFQWNGIVLISLPKLLRFEDAKSLTGMAVSKTAKNIIVQNTSEAIQRGAYGSPSFWVEGHFSLVHSSHYLPLHHAYTSYV